MRKKALLAVLAVLLSLGGVLVGRALTASTRQLDVEPAPPLALDVDAIAARLAGALAIPSISREDHAAVDGGAFRALHRYLEESFPGAHRALEREVVGEHSLLYTWAGRDPSLDPALLMSHLDVVPVEEGTLADWTHPPFSGAIEGGFVWGRGALDTKCGALAMLEAVELLAAESFRPTRTVLFAFGEDEETGGERGNGAIAASLRDRGARLAWILDEGGYLTEGLLDGIDRPVALVGVAEKGFATVRLSARGEGGHSSAPPDRTAVGRVAAAVARVEASPFPARIDGAAAEMFAYLAPEMPFARRLALANLWLLEPLVAGQLLAEPGTAATLRTTTAATRIDGGIQANVLPQSATARINFRLLAGDDVEGVLARVRGLVDDEEVEVELEGEAWDPSPISPTDAPAFERLQRTIHQVFPDALVAPYALIGATDTRHYRGLCDHVYRFLPVRVGPGDRERFHGTDERIGVENQAEIVRFLVRLLRNEG